MAKRVIILGVTQTVSELNVNYAMWYGITSGQRTQTSGSAWVGASAAENTAIQAGNVVEETGTRSFPLGTTTASIKDVLVNEWTQRNASIGGVGPNTYNGVYYDSGTGWSA